MADLLGISLVYYRKMENGDRPLSKQFEEKKLEILFQKKERVQRSLLVQMTIQIFVFRL